MNGVGENIEGKRNYHICVFTLIEHIYSVMYVDTIHYLKNGMQNILTSQSLTAWQLTYTYHILAREAVSYDSLVSTVLDLVSLSDSFEAYE